MKKNWWKEAVVYQIYPRSFKDSNGDGIGDIRGIIEKIDYICELGVDVVWLNPVYKSPNVDNGYDISDYLSVMQDFGTMEDLDELIVKLHKKGIKIILDLVLNHTSDKHPWFLQSRQSVDNPYRNYYVWRDRPNNWRSLFEGPAWTYDEQTGQYYLHIFAKEQPDLNWEHKPLREELYNMVNFWLDKGIDGFRLDAISLISKHPDFPDAEETGWDGLGNGTRYFMNGPRLHTYLRELYDRCFDGRDIMTVGECAGVPAEEIINIVGQSRKELNMVFYMDHMFVDISDDGYRFGRPYPRQWSWKELFSIIKQWNSAIAPDGWLSFYLGNHDFPRCVSRFGNDGEFLRESATMLAAFLLTMPGTIYIYQGDEIGMSNARFSDIEDYRDIESINYYKQVKEKGGDLYAAMEELKNKSRDNARTPMQWTAGKNAGFTEGKPWINLNPSYKDINVAMQKGNPLSVLENYRRLIALRKRHKNPLVYGRLIEISCEDGFIHYAREYEGDRLDIILNPSDKKIAFDLNYSSVLYNNYEQSELPSFLSPYQALILQ